jgi:mRNA-degrading endonuclease toxin of MazEF toxin-antitoxin module
MNRGDVILVRFPHPSGLRGKKRPAVVVQTDAYARTVSTLVVAVGEPIPQMPLFLTRED